MSADGWVQTDLFDPYAPVPYSLTPKAEVELSPVEDDAAAAARASAPTRIRKETPK